MECPSNRWAISSYTLEKAVDKQIRYAYTCCSVTAALDSISGESGFETERTEMGDRLLHAHYLDRQVVKCPYLGS